MTSKLRVPVGCPHHNHTSIRSLPDVLILFAGGRHHHPQFKMLNLGRTSITMSWRSHVNGPFSTDWRCDHSSLHDYNTVFSELNTVHTYPEMEKYWFTSSHTGLCDYNVTFPLIMLSVSNFYLCCNTWLSTELRLNWDPPNVWCHSWFYFYWKKAFKVMVLIRVAQVVSSGCRGFWRRCQNKLCIIRRPIPALHLNHI